MIVHNLSTIYPNLQIPGTGVGYIGGYLNIIILAGLNWIGIRPERGIMQVRRPVRRVPARQGVSGYNLQMVARKLDREWRRGMHTTTQSPVLIMHFCSDEPSCRVCKRPIGPIWLQHKLIADVDR